MAIHDASWRILSALRIEVDQRQPNDRECVALPNVFHGFENWHFTDVGRMCSALAIVPGNPVSDVGAGRFTGNADTLPGSFSVGTAISHVACAKARDYASE